MHSRRRKNVLSHAANKSCTTTLAVCKEKTFACRLTTVNDYTAAKLAAEKSKLKKAKRTSNTINTRNGIDKKNKQTGRK